MCMCVFVIFLPPDPPLIKTHLPQPMQYAGDTMVRLPSEGYKLIPGQRLAPFVADGTDLATLDIVSDRLFTLFNRLAAYVFAALALLTLGTLALLLACCCGCGGRKGAKAGQGDGSRSAAAASNATAAGRAAASPEMPVRQNGNNNGVHHRRSHGGGNGNHKRKSQ